MNHIVKFTLYAAVSKTTTGPILDIRIINAGLQVRTRKSNYQYSKSTEITA